MQNHSRNEKATALTILEQLGGNRFVAMTGARALVSSPDALSFSIGRGATKGINKVKIILADDLYRVEFYKLRGMDIKLIATVDGVYADRLQEVFTEQTGFDTHL